MSIETSDTDRYPALSEHGRHILQAMREHPHAPIFRNQSGHRLLPHEVPRTLEAEREILDATIDWSPNAPPAWLGDFLQHCFDEVPFYRRYGAPPARFSDLPTIDRGDLGHDIAGFVPDGVALERMIHFQTSGTTGHPLLLPSHPTVAAQYLAYHKRALRRFGIQLQHRRRQVGVILLGMQATCFTYVSVTPTMDESGLAKINLHPNDWRDVHDRRAYLEAMQPEVIAGDPISYTELLAIDPQIRPAALLSTAMTLTAALREELELRFGCPVLDLYSMNEAGPIAVFEPRVGGHVLLQPRMYVEIVDALGTSVREGERGEITVTGGFNFCLPLLRYRTGDFASLERRGDDLVLVDLAGRSPVRYRLGSGAWINNIDLTHALRPLAVRQFTVHQLTEGTVHVRYVAADLPEYIIERALRTLVGADTALQIERVANFEGKVLQYTSEFPGGH